MIANRNGVLEKARLELRRVLKDLPRENRLILILAAAEGLNDTEIAQVLGLDEKTVTWMRESLMDILEVIVGDVMKKGPKP